MGYFSFIACFFITVVIKLRDPFLLLSRKDKKTYREIAEIVGVTQSAIEQRMHLALVTLREQLGRKI